MLTAGSSCLVHSTAQWRGSVCPAVDGARALLAAAECGLASVWLCPWRPRPRQSVSEGPASAHVSLASGPRSVVRIGRGLPMTLAVSKLMADCPLASSGTRSSKLSWLGPFACHPHTALLHRRHRPSPWRPFLACCQCQHEAPLVCSTSGSAWGPLGLGSSSLQAPFLPSGHHQARVGGLQKPALK